MIKDLIQNKPLSEVPNIKARELAKLDHLGVFTNNEHGLTIEIHSLIKIDNGVEVQARAWKDGKPLGFSDGTVEIERFRIINPPILIPDGTFTTEINTRGDMVKILGYIESPVEAIRQSLAHTINLVGKDGTNIISGKVGSTTTTVYPEAGTGATSVDGDAYHFFSAGTSWATVQSATGDTTDGDSATPDSIQINSSTDSGNKWRLILRLFFHFDTSSIPDTDSISAATLSIQGSSKSDGLSISPTLNIYQSTAASNNTIIAGDYDQVGTTAFSSNITFAGFSTSAYNDWVLNASGLSNITKTGTSKFALRESAYDAPNVEPAWVSGTNSNMFVIMADAVGTTTDPKLVITHAAASTSGNNLSNLLGVG